MIAGQHGFSAIGTAHATVEQERLQSLEVDSRVIGQVGDVLATFRVIVDAQGLARRRPVHPDGHWMPRE